MAWPPAPLPINMTNLTPQQDVHPNLHNSEAQAINDTVARVQEMSLQLVPTGANFRQTGQIYSGGQVAVMGWNYRSTSKYGAGDVLTIPPGEAGLWAFTFRGGGPPPVGTHDIVIFVNGAAFQGGVLPGKGGGTVTATWRCEVGEQVWVQLYNSLGDSHYFNGDFSMQRAAY